MKIIQGKEIKGYSYADGVHWYWGDKEVAVINELRREIEWCDRTFNFPQEVVDDIRNRIPVADGVWIIEARRTRSSATQGNISIFVITLLLIGSLIVSFNLYRKNMEYYK